MHNHPSHCSSLLYKGEWLYTIFINMGDRWKYEEKPGVLWLLVFTSANQMPEMAQIPGSCQLGFDFV